jgi:hypothetical protein
VSSVTDTDFADEIRPFNAALAPEAIACARRFEENDANASAFRALVKAPSRA